MGLAAVVSNEEDLGPEAALKPNPLALVSGGDHLSPRQLTDLAQLQAAFADVFPPLPGRTNLVQHHIETLPGEVARSRPYRLPEHKKNVVQEELKAMLNLGVIEESHSDWASPIVLVPKTDGSVRFCVDYRKVNAVSKFDAYSMPRVDELLDRLGAARFYSTLDLTKGYWQIPLSPLSKEKTAFTTPFGLHQFVTLPFGLFGAPATFQRLMDKVLRPHSAYAAAYLDDIIIHSNDWQRHMEHLRAVLRSLREAGLTANPRKCAIGRVEVRYLGFHLGHGQVHPQIDKTQVKAALCGGPLLHSPNFDLPFLLQTDASDRGLGAVLAQVVGGEERPVLYLSRKLSKRETRYSTVEKECLAIRWAVLTLRYYLLGREFTLCSDHAPLQWLHRMKDTNARITRWYLALQPFKFKVVHRPGVQMAVADFLSRNGGGGGGAAGRRAHRPETGSGGMWRGERGKAERARERAIVSTAVRERAAPRKTKSRVPEEETTPALFTFSVFDLFLIKHPFVARHPWLPRPPSLNPEPYYSGLQLGLQYHHAWPSLRQTDTALCAHLHLSVEHQLPDRQAAASEAGQTQIQNSHHQHWRPSGLCSLPTALLPLHKWLHFKAPLCQAHKICRRHYSHRPHQG